jgi:hypothetical protein
MASPISVTPIQAQPVDYNAVIASANANARSQSDMQINDLIRRSPQLERMQLQSVNNVAAMLGTGGALQQWRPPTDKERRQAKKAGKKAEWVLETIGQAAPNEYTQMARGYLEDAMKQRGTIEGQAGKLSGIGDWITAAAQRNYNESGPTSIEARLYGDAERELELGRSLSAQEIRDTQQSARAAFAARGLSTSLGSSAAEILNRDAAGRAREADRRQFAAASNNLVNQNVMARRDQAANQASLGSGILGNSAQLSLGSANLGLAGSQGAVAIDPVSRAMGPALSMAQNIQGTLGQIIQPTYANSANTAAGMATFNSGLARDVASFNATQNNNAASFNANMAATNYNSYLNNQAALQAARMQAGATNRAATMGMLGSAIQGGIQAGGMVGAAQFAPAMFSDKRMKTDIKPLGKAGSVLGLTAYEFSYKGDDKKRVGFMAQDVQKVLPEAVTEVDYKGKKRLAIKPAVIGAALAEELMAAKAA